MTKWIGSIEIETVGTFTSGPMTLPDVRRWIAESRVELGTIHPGLPFKIWRETVTTKVEKNQEEVKPKKKPTRLRLRSYYK